MPFRPQAAERRLAAGATPLCGGERVSERERESERAGERVSERERESERARERVSERNVLQLGAGVSCASTELAGTDYRRETRGYGAPFGCGCHSPATRGEDTQDGSKTFVIKMARS